jgi:Peptidase family C25
MTADRVVLNGIDAATGEYLVPPMGLAELVAQIRGKADEEALAKRLSGSLQTQGDPHLGLPFNVRPEIVAEAGWGLVLHKDEPAEVRQALAPLVAHRRQRIGNDALVKEALEYKTGDDLASFLSRHGVGQGSVRPNKVPFYLLLIGQPDRIPFEFGHHLDVEYCVGRLHFDTAAEYKNYVDSVIAYEESGSAPTTAREAVFWAPRHALDAATQLSADQMVNPLLDGTAAQGAQPAEPSVLAEVNFASRKFWGKEATKQALLDTLRASGAAKTPALLFTASHGVGFKKDVALQRAAQGALLCQDWVPFKPVAPAHYLAAADIADDARVHGLVSFHFACYGAGTPRQDQFLHKAGQQPPEIAPSPFFARLPQRLLSHPNGAALACIGHVERAWGYSIVTPAAGAQLQPFRNCIGMILSGRPVGLAVKDFNERFASLSVTIASLLRQIGFGAAVSDATLASKWIERNDAGGYVVLGDPAVALRVDKM